MEIVGAVTVAFGMPVREIVGAVTMTKLLSEGGGVDATGTRGAMPGAASVGTAPAGALNGPRARAMARAAPRKGASRFGRIDMPAL
jgi:hypothetical protein